MPLTFPPPTTLVLPPHAGRTSLLNTIRDQAPRPKSSLSDEVSDLFEGTLAELRRLLEEVEGESSDSSESSSSSWDVDLGYEGEDEEAEVEDGEEVNQVLATALLVPALVALLPAQPQNADPIIVASLDSDRADDIAIVEPWEGHTPRNEPTRLPKVPKPAMSVPAEDQSIAPSSMPGGKQKRKQPTEGTSPQKKGKGIGSITSTPKLWTPQFTAVELGKHVTFADMSKDYETCIVLGNAVMLPQDIADHAAKTSSGVRGQANYAGSIVDLKKANQKANSLEKELKQTKAKLADERMAAEITTLQWNQSQQKASDLKAFACGEVYKKLFDRAFERAGDVYKRKLVELRPNIFQEGWLACLKKLEIPPDHLAWASPAPPVQPSASP
ncbi:hypothetical protein Acr_18g0008910 [Actinidia rufa]|uniref:Uncharacterized protein n=1 Tax=Actinidia rufa TaxID=165716 RepID=A0A7J0G7G2_9ERIC|nr:hypothetical protein Acr_18g0008910 [Actinidia rufa]